MTHRKNWGRTAFLSLALIMSARADGPPASHKGASDRKITLNMAKGEIGDALRLVAEQGGLNLVIGPEVKGDVSVYLSNATLTTALKAIAVNNGFEYTVDENVISVSKPAPKTGPEAPPPMITRIFTLRSQDAERVRDALEYSLSKYGRIKVLNENSQLGYGVQRLSNLANASGTSTGTGSGTGSPTPTGTGNTGAPGMPGSGMNGANGSSANQSGMTGGPGSQNPDHPRSSRTLVVTDIRENVERVAQLIADLDRLPPQVLIEARIVEMSTQLQRQLGIEWNINAVANGPILNHEWPLNNHAGFASGSQIRRNVSGAPQQSAGLALGTIDFSRLTATLHANQNDTSIRLLANPRMLVYNNHSASILVGERYPILRANITDFGTVTEAFDSYIPVGVQLEVTPTIMLDGTVSMLVHPATSSLGDDVVGTTGLKIARILTREIDTRVIMTDGQTIVLGGLLSDRKQRRIDKVPGLGDIPILDIFFRSETPATDRVDLLVFLTAHIEGAVDISERDQRVYDMYRPHFKHVERLQDVPLHFEIPTEYQPPKPMFGDPPKEEMQEAASEESDIDSGKREEIDTQDVRRQMEQRTLPPKSTDKRVATTLPPKVGANRKTSIKEYPRIMNVTTQPSSRVHANRGASLDD